MHAVFTLITECIYACSFNFKKINFFIPLITSDQIEARFNSNLTMTYSKNNYNRKFFYIYQYQLFENTNHPMAYFSCKFNYTFINSLNCFNTLSQLVDEKNSIE